MFLDQNLFGKMFYFKLHCSQLYRITDYFIWTFIFSVLKADFSFFFFGIELFQMPFRIKFSLN